MHINLQEVLTDKFLQVMPFFKLFRYLMLTLPSIMCIIVVGERGVCELAHCFFLNKKEIKIIQF